MTNKMLPPWPLALDSNGLSYFQLPIDASFFDENHRYQNVQADPPNVPKKRICADIVFTR
jgi:hypothetical protein